MNLKSYITKIKQSAVVLVLPILMYILLGPVEVFYGSNADFEFELKDFIGIFLIVALVILVVSSIIISLFPQKIFVFILSLITTFSILSYVQNMFLNKKLTGAVGLGLDWSKYKKYTVINTVIWIVGIIIVMVCLYHVKKQIKSCVMISVILSLIQLAALVSILVNLSSDRYKVSYYKLNTEDEYTLASDENIIVLLLDATGNQLFDEELEKDPTLINGLEDFTYYTNYEPCYMPTFPAVTYLWTNEYVDNSVPKQEYTDRAWNSDRTNDFFNEIHNQGYKVHFYVNYQRVLFGDVKNLCDKVDNVSIQTPTLDKKKLFVMLEKYSVYRYAPYIAKPYFEVNPEHFRGVVLYDEANEITEKCALYNEKIKEEGLKVSEEYDKAVIYHHFDGVHGPTCIDEEGNYVPGDDTTLESQRVAVKGNMVFIRNYLDELKELGLYDNSTIIISADHGNVLNQEDMQCVFFIKTKGEKHNQLQYSSSPVSAEDFQATLLYLIGDEGYNNYGTTIFDWKEGDKRERTSFVRDYGETGYLSGYTYFTDRNELYKTIEDGADILLKRGDNDESWR